MKNNHKGLMSKPLGMFLLLFSLVLISKLIFILISDLCLNFIWKINIEILFNDIIKQDFKFTNAQKFIGFIDQISTFLIPAILLIKLSKGIHIGIKKISINDVYIIVFSLFFLLALTNVLTIISTSIDLSFLPKSWGEYLKNQQILQDNIQKNFIDTSLISFLINVFIMALTPAICEEMFFRGTLQPILILWTKRKSTGIIITSLIFGILHFQIENLLAIVFASVLFGYLYIIKKNLIHTILIHFTFNCFSLFTLQLIKNKVYEEVLIEKFINYSITPIGILIGIVWCYKCFKKN